MKSTIFGVVCVCVLALSCNQQSQPDHHHDEVSAYACSMRCEGDKTYPAPGKCPVCGMALKPVSGAAASVQYEMRLALSPATPEAGKPATLSFTPKIKGNENAPVPLDEVHEKKLHVIIVSKDLSWYSHIHPEFSPNGAYTVNETFPASGEHIIFADYQPTGGGNQVERIVVNVSGTPAVNKNFNTESLSTETDGYVVKLVPAAESFLTNNMNHLGVEVTLDGKPYRDFENIMGAKGHLVIISGDGQKYIHVHPDEVEGKLDLHTQFDQPGFYRAFFQFQTNGKLHTSYFTIDVKEGKPGEIESHSQPSHHHNG